MPPPLLGHVENPNPGITEALALGVYPASLTQRSVAYAVDFAVGVLTLLPAAVGTILLTQEGREPWPWPGLLLIIGILSFTAFFWITVSMHGRHGTSVGKKAMGLRSMSVESVTAPGFANVAVRALTLSGANLLPVVGPAVLFLSSTWDPQRLGRSWLDKIGNCVVVDAKRGLNPLDEAQLLAARRHRDFSAVFTAEPRQDLNTGAHPSRGRINPNLAPPRSLASVVGFAGSLTGWPDAASSVAEYRSNASSSVSASRPQLVPPAPSPAETGANRAAFPAPPPPASLSPANVGSEAFPAPPPPSSAAMRHTTTSAAGIPEPPPPFFRAANPTDATVYPGAFSGDTYLAFDDGEFVRAPKWALLGRAPRPTEETHGAKILKLSDPENKLSKSHAEFGMDDGGCWIRDLGSTNGTFVTGADGETDQVPPRQKRYLEIGDMVLLSSRAFQLVPQSTVDDHDHGGERP